MPGKRPLLLTAILIAGLFVEAIPWLTAWLQWRRNPLVRGDCEAIVSTAGVAVRGQAATAEYAWAAFRRVDETERSFLLAFSSKAQGPVLVLPKRALTNPADIFGVRDLLYRMIPLSPA